MDKLYHNSITSTFIKQLLSKENIPLCDVVVTGDIIVQGLFYIYDTYVIKCVRTGVFAHLGKDNLHPSQTIYPSEVLLPSTGSILGKYVVVNYYNVNDYIPSLTYNYVSNTSYYDSKTHYHLGRYLRYKSREHNINLMPYYNHFAGDYASDIYIIRSIDEETNEISYKLSNTSRPEYKIASIPINFNTLYTVAVECPTEVIIGYRIYDEDSGIVFDENKEDISNRLYGKFITFSSMHFNKPCLINCPYETALTQDTIGTLQHNLKLLIQLPYNNTSSIVVIEGDYTQNIDVVHNMFDDTLVPSIYSSDNSFYDLFGSKEDYLNELNRLEMGIKLNTKPLLLQYNTGESYPYSPRLIEHLLLNVIDSSESLTGNIERLHNLCMSVDPVYRYHVIEDNLPVGTWNGYLTYSLNRLVSNMQMTTMLYDQGSGFNVDLERALTTYRKVDLYNV